MGSHLLSCGRQHTFLGACWQRACLLVRNPLLLLPLSPPIHPCLSHTCTPPPPPRTCRARPQLDLTAYTGYVYVPLVVNSLAGLLLGRTAYLVAFAYTALAFIYFLVSTLQPLLANRAGGGLGGVAEAASAAAGGARRTFALCIGALQLVLLWWLGPRL